MQSKEAALQATDQYLKDKGIVSLGKYELIDNKDAQIRGLQNELCFLQTPINSLQPALNRGLSTTPSGSLGRAEARYSAARWHTHHSK